MDVVFETYGGYHVFKSTDGIPHSNITGDCVLETCDQVLDKDSIYFSFPTSISIFNKNAKLWCLEIQKKTRVQSPKSKSKLQTKIHIQDTSSEESFKYLQECQPSKKKDEKKNIIKGNQVEKK